MSDMSNAAQKAWWPFISPNLDAELHASSHGVAPSTDGAQTPRRFGRNLPFRVRLVRTPDQLQKAVEVRQRAYSKHLPTLADLLSDPEGADSRPDSIVLLAESKEDGSPLGTMRIQSNFTAPLDVEAEFELPSRFQQRSIAHVTRLGILPQRNSSLVKLALFKALHRYCLAVQIDWMLATGIPPIDRQYDRLGFIDVLPSGTLITLRATGGLPARLLCFEVNSAERRWQEPRHPLYEFMFQTYHPDIEIFNSVKSMWAQPRASRQPAVHLT